MLIILDTCRPDAIKTVMDEYNFIADVDTRWSVGASSPEWILNTFNKDYLQEINKTAYITSNPHAVTVIEQQLTQSYKGRLSSSIKRLDRYSSTKPVKPESFHTFIPLYQYDSQKSDGIYTKQSKNNYPSPRMVTDHVIDVDRNENPSRIVAHYMPPHTPYITRRDDNGNIVLGEKRSSTCYEAYLDNLHWALNEIEILLENVNRDTVIISSDHGENFFLRKYRSRHQSGMLDPSVRIVPWIVTEAVDTGNYQPEFEASESNAKADEGTKMEEILEALGYI